MRAWREKLAAGDVDAAWNDFVAEYERLILATIGRTLGDSDDVPDVIAEVYASLSSDGMARLQQHREIAGAKFSTWLVTVVHHQAIDWVRKRDGRNRFRPPPNLSALQQAIFRHVFLERRSHVEAYEIVRQQTLTDISFGAFLKEVSTTYRLVEQARGRTATGYFAGPPSMSDQHDETIEDAMMRAESGSRLAAALSILPADERLAVQLFVVHGVGADRVARAVGWPNAKSVYNRVYRALALVRKELERTGFEKTAY